MAQKYKRKRNSIRRKSIRRKSNKKAKSKKQDFRRQSAKKRVGKRRRTTFANAIQRLSKLRPNQRVEAMKLANNKFIQQFCNNVKKLRRTPLSSTQHKRMRTQSKNIRKLISSKTSYNTKRKMLTQRGGFLLPLLLPPLLSAGVGAITSALSK